MFFNTKFHHFALFFHHFAKRIHLEEAASFERPKAEHGRQARLCVRTLKVRGRLEVGTKMQNGGKIVQNGGNIV